MSVNQLLFPTTHGCLLEPPRLGGMLGARGININEGPTTISKPSINTRRNEASTSLGNSAMEHNIDVWKKSKAGLFETCG